MASLDRTSSQTVREWMENYDNVHVDLGTGDGTFALHMARTCADTAVIGIDTCLDNLTKASLRGASNLRFMSCDAVNPPPWLYGAATRISINFPYGSLLRALTDGEEEVQRRLFAVAKPGARVEIRVNGSATKELGASLEDVQAQLERMNREFTASSVSITLQPHNAFRRFPSAWAKRLAFGRPSQVVVATARISAS